MDVDEDPKQMSSQKSVKEEELPTPEPEVQIQSAKSASSKHSKEDCEQQPDVLEENKDSKEQSVKCSGTHLLVLSLTHIHFCCPSPES